MRWDVLGALAFSGIHHDMMIVGLHLTSVARGGAIAPPPQ